MSHSGISFAADARTMPNSGANDGRRFDVSGRQGSLRKTWRPLRPARHARASSEGAPYPLGANWDGLGVNFALFSAHATKVELCLFDDAGEQRDRADRAARIHRRDLARLPARRPARHDLRLPRPRPLRAEGRPPLQPQQAPDRPLRQGARRLHHLEPGPVRLPDGDRRRPHLRRARQRALHPPQPRDRPGLHLGPRPQAATCRGRRPSSTRPT